MPLVKDKETADSRAEESLLVRARELLGGLLQDLNNAPHKQLRGLPECFFLHAPQR